MDLTPDLNKAYRLSVIITGAIILSLFIYAVIVEIIKAQLKPFQGFTEIRDLMTLRYAFYGVAIIMVLVVRFLQRALAKARPGEDFQMIILKLSRATVITAVLCEIPAFLGIVLFLLAGTGRDLYYLLFVSLFLEVLYFPRRRVWEELLGSKSPHSQA